MADGCRCLTTRARPASRHSCLPRRRASTRTRKQRPPAARVQRISTSSTVPYIHTYSYVRDQPAQAPFPGGDGAVHAVAPCAHGVSRTSEGRAALHSSGGSIPCGGVGVVCSAPAVRGAIRGGSRSSRAALRGRGRGGTSARQYVPRIAADARCPLVPCINSLWTFLRPPTHPPLAVTCVR